jgi:uncharacterized protein YukE
MSQQEKLKKELRDLTESWKSKQSGMSVNEYSTTFYQLSQKIKQLNKQTT